MGFNSSQTEQIFTHLIGQSGREFSSPTHTLIIDRNQLVVEPLKSPMKTMKIPETGHYRYTDDLRFSFIISDDVKISKSDNSITLDTEKVQFPLTIRSLQPGDTFCPFGMKGHKLVSDFLTDRKMNILQKRRQLVVTDAQGEIIWLVGLRTDNRYKVEKKTRSVLRITVLKTL